MAYATVEVSGKDQKHDLCLCCSDDQSEESGTHLTSCPSSQGAKDRDLTRAECDAFGRMTRQGMRGTIEKSGFDCCGHDSRQSSYRAVIGSHISIHDRVVRFQGSNPRFTIVCSAVHDR